MLYSQNIGINWIFYVFSLICRDIIKSKNTNNVDPTPFIGGMAM